MNPRTATLIQGAIRSARARERLVKAAQRDRRYVLGVAYPADALDLHGEYMTADTVEATAWEYLQDGGRQVGLYHSDGTMGHGQVVESYIHRGPDWQTVDASGTAQVVKAGDWLLGVIFDDQTWPLVKSGRITGWSIDGTGRRRTVPRSQTNLA